MEEKTNSIWKSGFIYGAILGLIMIIYTVLLYVMDQSFNRFLPYLNYVFLAIIVFYGAKSYRDNSLDGFINYGRALGISMIIVGVAAIISSVYFFVHISVVDTEYVTKLLMTVEEGMLEKGMPDDQIEMAVSVQKKMMKPGILSVLSFLGIAFWGLVISLITSIFVKKQGDPYQEAMQDIEE